MKSLLLTSVSRSVFSIPDTESISIIQNGKIKISSISNGKFIISYQSEVTALVNISLYSFQNGILNLLGETKINPQDSYPSDEVYHNLINAFIEKNSILLFFSSGLIIGISHDLSNAFPLGVVEGGISQIHTSPDYAIIAIFSNDSVDLLLLASESLETIARISLSYSVDERNLALPKVQPVTVGWGSTETQFRGAGAKVIERKAMDGNIVVDVASNEDAVDKEASLAMGQLSLFSEGNPCIDDHARHSLCWHQDSSRFAISFPDGSFRVYARDGTLFSSSDSISPGKEAFPVPCSPMSWKGSFGHGFGIAALKQSSQKKHSPTPKPESNKSTFTLSIWEPNCLERESLSSANGQCMDLNFSSSFVKNISWNPAGDILLLGYSDGFLQFYTTTCYQFDMKREIPSLENFSHICSYDQYSAQSSLTIPRFTSVLVDIHWVSNNLLLNVTCITDNTDGSVRVVLDYFSLILSPVPDKIGDLIIVPSRDTLRVTPISKGILPPPLCRWKAHNPSGLSLPLSTIIHGFSETSIPFELSSIHTNNSDHSDASSFLAGSSLSNKHDIIVAVSSTLSELVIFDLPPSSSLSTSSPPMPINAQDSKEKVSATFQNLKERRHRANLTSRNIPIKIPSIVNSPLVDSLLIPRELYWSDSSKLLVLFISVLRLDGSVLHLLLYISIYNGIVERIQELPRGECTMTSFPSIPTWSKTSTELKHSLELLPAKHPSRIIIFPTILNTEPRKATSFDSISSETSSFDTCAYTRYTLDAQDMSNSATSKMDFSTINTKMENGSVFPLFSYSSSKNSDSLSRNELANDMIYILYTDGTMFSFQIDGSVLFLGKIDDGDTIINQSYVTQEGVLFLLTEKQGAVWSVSSRTSTEAKLTLLISTGVTSISLITKASPSINLLTNSITYPNSITTSVNTASIPCSGHVPGTSPSAIDYQHESTIQLNSDYFNTSPHDDNLEIFLIVTMNDSSSSVQFYSIKNSVLTCDEIHACEPGSTILAVSPSSAAITLLVMPRGSLETIFSRTILGRIIQRLCQSNSPNKLKEAFTMALRHRYPLSSLLLAPSTVQQLDSAINKQNSQQVANHRLGLQQVTNQYVMGNQHPILSTPTLPKVVIAQKRTEALVYALSPEQLIQVMTDSSSTSTIRSAIKEVAKNFLLNSIQIELSNTSNVNRINKHDGKLSKQTQHITSGEYSRVSPEKIDLILTPPLHARNDLISVILASELLSGEIDHAMAFLAEFWDLITEENRSQLISLALTLVSRERPSYGGGGGAEMLLSASLGIYFLPLALAVAEQGLTQRDPQEYLQFLTILSSYSTSSTLNVLENKYEYGLIVRNDTEGDKCHFSSMSRQRFMIDDRLKRWGKALHWLVLDFSSTIEEIIDYVRRKSLFSEAFSLLRYYSSISSGRPVKPASTLLIEFSKDPIQPVLNIDSEKALCNDRLSHHTLHPGYPNQNCIQEFPAEYLKSLIFRGRDAARALFISYAHSNLGHSGRAFLAAGLFDEAFEYFLEKKELPGLIASFAALSSKKIHTLSNVDNDLPFKPLPRTHLDDRYDAMVKVALEESSISGSIFAVMYLKDDVLGAQLACDSASKFCSRTISAEGAIFPKTMTSGSMISNTSTPGTGWEISFILIFLNAKNDYRKALELIDSFLFPALQSQVNQWVNCLSIAMEQIRALADNLIITRSQPELGEFDEASFFNEENGTMNHSYFDSQSVISHLSTSTIRSFKGSRSTRSGVLSTGSTDSSRSNHSTSSSHSAKAEKKKRKQASKPKSPAHEWHLLEEIRKVSSPILLSSQVVIDGLNIFSLCKAIKIDFSDDEENFFNHLNFSICQTMGQWNEFVDLLVSVISIEPVKRKLVRSEVEMELLFKDILVSHSQLSLLIQTYANKVTSISLI